MVDISQFPDRSPTKKARSQRNCWSSSGRAPSNLFLSTSKPLSSCSNHNPSGSDPESWFREHIRPNLSGHHSWETDFLPLLVLTRRGRSTGKSQYWLVIVVLENAREFPEMITSTGARFWPGFCPSVLALVIFKSPNSLFSVHMLFPQVFWAFIHGVF